jgi:hypothetical protein
MKSGKLYKCPKHFLLVYPSKKIAARAQATAETLWDPSPEDKKIPAAGILSPFTNSPTPEQHVEEVAKSWSGKLECQIFHENPGEVFMCLKQCNQFVCVLFGKKQGWIIAENWLNIERIK